MLPSGEERFRVLFERSPVAMAIASVDGTVIAVNAAACTLWGRTEQELVGASGLDVVHPDDRTKSSGHLRQMLEGRLEEVRTDRQFIRPDGSVVWAESLTQVVRAPDGTPLYLQSSLVDATDRRRAEEARSWLAAIVESSQDAIVGATLDGVVMSWNAGAERIFGYTAQEMVGRSATVLRPPGSDRDVARLTKRIGRGERIENRVVRLRKDGSSVTLMSTTSPIRDAAGDVVGTATVARDLSDEQRGQAMFRSLLEAAPDAVVCVDHDGVIALVNAQAEELFGYARDEMIGRPLEMLVPDRAKDIHPAHRQGYFAHPEPRPMGAGQELAARRKDGSEFPAEISLSALQTQEGALVSAAIRDGTERRQAAIVASSSDAIVGRSLDGTITSWNAGAERMYGYTATEAIGSDLAVLSPPDRSGELIDMMERVRRGESVEHYETQRLRKDGATIEVSVTMSPIRDGAGAVVGTSAVARDITEPKRAVEALRALEARKSAVLESSLDCVITMDHQGRIVEFNSAAEQVFGYDRDRVLGRPLADLIIPAAMRDAHRAGLARYLATGEGPVLGRRLELSALRADGTEFPVELAITRVQLPGQPVFTASLRDITDRRRAEAERKALEARLHQSERLESLGQLAGGIAHDFNNLLAAIMNYAEFVAEETADRPAVRADVAQIQAAAERAARLTKQLLIFGRREPVQPQALDLNGIVAEIHNLLSRSIGEHVQLRVEPAQDLPAIRADRGQVEQVLLNLAVNARDAMPDGGTLTIETSPAELDEAYVTLRPEAIPGHYVELAVSDTGVGMSAEVVGRIFEPFFTTKPKGQGTGLGLATVYGIITEAGGSMSVYSEEGIGTTFRLYFPASARPVPATPTAQSGPLGGQGETILVVEDEPAVLELTCRILRQDGYAVLEAGTFQEALSLAAARDFQLLLTDSVMPQMSGRALAERVTELRPEAAVLYMSGYSEGVLSPRRVLDDGVALLHKPFNRHTLLEHVRAALDTRGTESPH